MGDSAAPDVSEAAAAQAAAPVYVHKLSDHQVQGDATFKEINDFQTPYEGGAEKAQRYAARDESNARVGGHHAARLSSSAKQVLSCLCECAPLQFLFLSPLLLSLL